MTRKRYIGLLRSFATATAKWYVDEYGKKPEKCFKHDYRDTKVKFGYEIKGGKMDGKKVLSYDDAWAYLIDTCGDIYNRYK